jgi:hypothetical protein
MPPVEDLVETLMLLQLKSAVEKDPWKANFIYSVADQISFGRALSDAQVKVVMKLIGQHKSTLARELRLNVSDIDYILANPTYRQSVVPSKNIPREVRFVGENILAFRYKLDPVLVREIKGLRCGRFQKPLFNRRHRIWLVPVNRENVTDIQDIITTHKFAYDMETYNLVMKIRQSKSVHPAIKYDNQTDDLSLQTADQSLLTQLVKMVTR